MRARSWPDLILLVACRSRLQQEASISVHADAVVNYTNHCGSASRDRYFDPTGARVDAVFDEFFDHGSRSLHHFSSGDLACHFIRQKNDSAHSSQYNEARRDNRGKRSAFSVQRSAFKVQRSTFNVLAAQWAQSGRG